MANEGDSIKVGVQIEGDQVAITKLKAVEQARRSMAVDMMSSTSKAAYSTPGMASLDEDVNNLASSSLPALSTATQKVKRSQVDLDAELLTAKKLVKELKDEEDALIQKRKQQGIYTDQITDKTNKATDANKKLGISAGDMRFRIMQAAFQFQDIGIQLQMGMDPVMVMAQQLPQLLSVFGSGGAIAGAVISIGSLIYKWASANPELEKTKEYAKQLREELGALEQSKAAEAMEKYVTSMDHAIDAEKNFSAALLGRFQVQGQIAQAEGKMSDAQRATQSRMLDFAEKHFGMDVTDARQALNVQATGAKRDQEVGAQQRDIQAAEEATSNADSQRVKRTLQVEKLQDDVDRMKNEKADMAAFISNLKIISDAMKIGINGMPAYMSDPVTEKRMNAANAAVRESPLSQKYDTSTAIDQIRIQEETPSQESDLSRALKTKSNDLKIAENSFRKAQSDLTSAEDTLKIAAEQERQKKEAAQANIDAANAAYDEERKQQRLESAGQEIDKATQDLKTFADTFQPIGRSQTQALNRIKGYLADGGVTAEEFTKAGADMQQIMAWLQDSQQGQVKSIQDLMKETLRVPSMMLEIQNQTKQLRSDLDKVMKKING